MGAARFAQHAMNGGSLIWTAVRLLWRARAAANRLLQPRVPSREDLADYCCNICGTHCRTPRSQLARETPSCAGCRSTPRYRAVIAALSEELFGASLSLPDFPVRRDLRGAGLTDWQGYARGLAAKLSYGNTYYHREPRLDITNVPAGLEGALDFVISSEVFEHVAPPVSLAFRNAHALLKRGGVLILTVPYVSDPTGAVVEHFPHLHDYHVEELDGRKVLINTTASGNVERFTDLVYHGGEGDALEMRIFSERGVIEELERAHFGEVRIAGFDPAHGAWWNDPLSRVIVARAL